MLFSWIFISIVFDVAFIMLLGMLRSLVSVVREKFDQSAETLRKFRSKAQKSATESKGISLETGHGQILDYLDAAVQVNESMLPKKKDREFPLVLSSENDTLIYKKGKLIIHQGSNRPDVIPEEISDQESQRAGKATSSSPNAAPKPALKGGSRSGSSSDSFNSAVTTSPRGSNGSNASNGSKTVSWEQSSTRSEDVKPASSPSEAGTPSQVRRSGSVQQKQAQEASTPVLDLLPLAHQTAFQTFRKLCANDDLLDRPSGLVKRDLQLGVNDDITLFRFFTARKCDIHEAYNQFQEAHATREHNDILGFYNRMDVDDFEETRGLYPHWVGRRDKRGLPIYLFDFGRMDPKVMNAYRKASASIHGMKIDSKLEHATSPELVRAMAIYDHLTRFVLPLCSGSPGGPDPVHKTLHLVDVTGIGIRQVWNLRSYVQDLSRLLSRNYPEILDHVFIIGAPSYFSTIWGWIKNWVDPGTVEKLRVLSRDEVLPTLKEYVELENIPTRFGGHFKYEPGMAYDLDPAIARRLVWLSGSNNTLPLGPIKWVATGDGCKMAVAVGSRAGKERVQKLAVIR